LLVLFVSIMLKSFTKVSQTYKLFGIVVYYLLYVLQIFSSQIIILLIIQVDYAQ